MAMVAFALLSACSTMTIRIPRSELQADMARRFPVETDKHVVLLKASDPQIELFGDKAAVRLRLEATSHHSRLTGTSRVEGRIEYVATEHAFYLRDPKVTELVLDAESKPLLERACRSAVELLLRTHPVYRLDANRSAKEAKAIRHLRSVHVEDEHLVLEVGL